MLLQVPGSIKKLNISLKMCILFARYMLHGIHFYNILSTVLTLMYSQCIQFVLSLHTRNSV